MEGRKFDESTIDERRSSSLSIRSETRNQRTENRESRPRSLHSVRLHLYQYDNCWLL